MYKLWPSPPWGRGWPAAGAFISRSGPGEGVVQFDNQVPLAVSLWRRSRALAICTSLRASGSGDRAACFRFPGIDPLPTRPTSSKFLAGP